MTADPWHPEGIYQCQGCGRTYPEYVNGCISCWDDDLTIEENQREYPRRAVVLIVEEACP